MKNEISVAGDKDSVAKAVAEIQKIHSTMVRRRTREVVCSSYTCSPTLCESFYGLRLCSSFLFHHFFVHFRNELSLRYLLKCANPNTSMWLVHVVEAYRLEHAYTCVHQPSEMPHYLTMLCPAIIFVLCFLVQEILGNCGVWVEVPSPETDSNTITLRGPQEKLGQALTQVATSTSFFVKGSLSALHCIATHIHTLSWFCRFMKKPIVL